MKKLKAESIYDYLDIILPEIKYPVIFELGAHVGGDTIRILQKCKSNPRYYAFEPDPRNLQWLRTQIRPFKINVFDIALSNFDDNALLYQSTGRSEAHPENYDHTASSSIKAPVVDPNYWLKYPSAVVVKTNKLDTFCHQHKIDHIDFIWSDIQGSEPDMIEGAQNILQKTKFLYMEYISGGTPYKDIKSLGETLKLLPDYWEVIHQFPDDILLENTSI